MPAIEGKLEGIWDETLTSPVLFAVALGDVAAFLKLIPSDLAPTYFFSGLAYSRHGDRSRARRRDQDHGTFAGAGPWTMDPAPYAAEPMQTIRGQVAP